MKKGFDRKARTQDGFTLVELMITILILSILVSIVVMTMALSRSKAQRAACKSNLRIIHDAIVQYQSVYESSYPPNLDVLVDGSEPSIKPSFKWLCPAGDYGTNSGDYRKYYNSSTGETSCPRLDHNL